MLKFADHPETSSGGLNLSLLFLRLAAGGLMLTHGIPKLNLFFSDDAIHFSNPFGIGAVPTLSLTVFSEVVCSVLLIFGLKTRWTSVPLIITMIVAAFVIHADDPLRKKEMALLYLIIFVFLLICGAGKHSLDYFLMRNKKNR